jgi:glycosyltransferase involved in cell wall biosynthesis
MRVVMVIQKYYPFVGGAERQLQQLSARLKARGVEVSVLTRRYGNLPAFEIVDGVPVHRLPAPGPKPLAALIFIASALWRIRQLHPQVVHAHELLSPATVALNAKRLFGSRAVAKVLGGGKNGDISKIRERSGEARMRDLRENLDAFIAVSREIDGELEQAGVQAEKRFYIPNGVDTERFAPLAAEDKTHIRMDLGLDPTAPTVVYIGRLHPAKRVDLLLEAWPVVRASHPSARLLVIGSGEEEPALRAMQVAGVDFLGQKEEVLPYLRAADVYVLPSSREGLSNSMLEALAAGLPVIATAVGGTPDVIRHEQDGLLIPPDDGDALQSALLRLLGDVQLQKQLGAQGRARIVAEYSLEAAVERVMRLYEELMKG